MKLLKLILAIFFGLLSIFFVFANSDYLEYADIPDTDTINFNGIVDGNVYRVRINTGELDYITGSDNKLHSCFPIVGTGYTDKLGEIYFQYNGFGTYICDDWKLRGIFKIGAGGWGYCESENDTWKLYLMKTLIDNYHYHDNGNNGTGQAWLDNIGFSNWNSTKTKFNPDEAFSNFKVIAIPQYTDLIANGNVTGTIIFKFFYPNNSDPSNPYILKNFTFSNIQFISGFNSDIQINGNISAGFKYVGGLTTDVNGIITGSFIAYHPGKNLEFGIKISIGDYSKIITGTFYNKISTPFIANLEIQPDEISDKKIIGYNNLAKISITNEKVNNLGFSNLTTNLNLNGFSDYFIVETGNYILFNQQENLKIIYNLNTFFSQDYLPIFYDFTTDYYFKIGNNTYYISSFSGSTTTDYLYKYGLVKEVKLVHESNYALADGKQIFWYKAKFLDSFDYPINHLTFDVLANDREKFFNLNLGEPYETGFFILTSDILADSNGIYKIGVISYKPISADLQAFLTGLISNIKYNGYYEITSTNQSFILNNLVFNQITNFIPENKTINVNKQTNISVSYTTGTNNISNGSFNLTGYIIGCNSCSLEEGKTVSGNNFGDFNYDIYINGGTDPDELIYSGYLSYNVDGNYGDKKVYVPYSFYYDSFLFIGGGTLQILGNILTNKKILGGLSYISTIKSPSIFKNKLRKFFFGKIIRGSKITKINSTTNIDISTISGQKIYKCTNNAIINIYGTYDKNMSLYFIDCQVNIQNNIISTNKEHLKIISLASQPKEIKYDEENGWITPGNIYISPNVNTIQADLITDGSILTYADTDFSLDNDKIFFENRGNNDSLKNQLFINGKIFSKNTIGGGLQNSDNKYMLIGGKYVTSEWYGFNGISASTITEAYDIKFWRDSFVKEDGSYNTWNLSKIIYNKYHCTGNKDTDLSPLCYTTIIIMDSKY